MTPILSYLLKANIVLVALYSVYYLCFRRDTFYGYNRWYLLATIVSVMLFPMIDISGWLAGSPAIVEVSQHISDVNVVYQYILLQPQTEYVAEPTVAKALPWNLILWWCWFPVTILLSGKRLFQLAGIMRLWYRYPKKRHENQEIVSIDKNIQPFSFSGRIFLNPSLYSGKELDEIVTHEQVHCRQGHTIDNLLAEALVCLCWFNPVAWLLRRDLKQNLEYYTDHQMLLAGFDRKHYQYSLLRISGSTFQIANHFKFNHLKKRIIMLNKKESPRIMAVKYLLVVPVLTAVLLVLQMSGLQAAEEYLSISVSTVDEYTDDTQTEWMNSLFVDDTHAVTTVITNSDTEKTAPMFPDTITKKEDNVSWGVYKGSASMSIDGNATVIKGDSVVIRGNPWSKALVLIDGLEGDINSLDPADIESFSVLKDASATAVYGVRGANGVILVTTKRSEPSLREDTLRHQDIQKISGFWMRGVGGTASRPLIIFDGKIISDEDFNKIDPSTVKSFNVLKGKNATDLYGEEAADGVILITTKKSEPSLRKDTLQHANIQKISDFWMRGITASRPLIILDGKEVDNIENIPYESIKSVSVLKDASATAIYGEKYKNGVVMITTKK